MARARGDYSDFVIGEIYPNTLVRILSEVFNKPDEISGKNRQYVKYTCTACNSGKIYDETNIYRQYNLDNKITLILISFI